MAIRLATALLLLWLPTLGFAASSGIPAGGDAPFTDNGEKLPTVDEAFQVDVSPEPRQKQLDVHFAVAPHCYLYRKRLGFRLVNSKGKVIDRFPDAQIPKGETKQDEVFGKVQVFHEDLDVKLPVKNPPADAMLEVDYQGCLEDQLCYPPQTRRYPLDFSVFQSLSKQAEKAADTTGGQSGDDGFFATLHSQDANTFSQWMQGHNLGMVVILFFAGGLLLAFTPCVFPMIPILTGIIAGEDNPSARRGFTLSLAYVLGVSVPYTLAGVLVAVFGAGLNMQYWLQQPVAIIVSAVIFVLLALAMFGVYELQLPAFVRDRLNSAAPGRGGSLVGAALMGVISALVVSPCVTPILAGALVYVAGTGNAVTGALALFSLAMGMGVPLILVGTGGGSLLPKAGGWMEEIKRFFGVVMLGIAIWLLDRIVADAITLALYGFLVAIYGVHLGALEPVREGQSRLKRAVALLLALYGAIMVVGAAGGGTDPFQPLHHSGQEQRGTSATSAGKTGDGQKYGAWHVIKGEDTLNRDLARAQSDGRPVLVDFYADWCVACRILTKKVLEKPRVVNAMHRFLLLRVDITDVNRGNKQIMKHYRILGLPTLVFLSPQGREIPDSRITGEMDIDRFIKHLNRKVFPAI